ncbi:MAG TPA: NAD-dependent epimerase/dehydratase family protein [Candidatus Dormibacteraeota bacterium]
MRVVVTGGAGFIGSHVVDALCARGDEVLVLDDLSSGRRDQVAQAALFYESDVRSADAALAVSRFRPDAIMHLAAQMSVSRSVREPLFDAEVNILGSLNMLEAARSAGARFVFASTGGALYGDAGVLPTPEAHAATPISPYGVSKLAVEHYLDCYRVTHGVRAIALRYANVYGPRQNPHGEAGVVAIFCKNLVAGQTSTINGDGTQTRDYTYVGDVVQAVLLALDSDVCGAFNVGTGQQTDVNTLFEILSGCFSSPAPAAHAAARPGEQLTSALDCTLISARLGWHPEVEIADGLRLTASWFQRNAGVALAAAGPVPISA